MKLNRKTRFVVMRWAITQQEVIRTWRYHDAKAREWRGELESGEWYPDCLVEIMEERLAYHEHQFKVFTKKALAIESTQSIRAKRLYDAIYGEGEA